MPNRFGPARWLRRLASCSHSPRPARGEVAWLFAAVGGWDGFQVEVRCDERRLLFRQRHLTTSSRVFRVWKGLAFDTSRRRCQRGQLFRASLSAVRRPWRCHPNANIRGTRRDFGPLRPVFSATSCEDPGAWGRAASRWDHVSMGILRRRRWPLVRRI